MSNYDNLKEAMYYLYELRTIEELESELQKREAVLKIYIKINKTKKKNSAPITKQQINNLKDEIKTIKYFISYKKYADIVFDINIALSDFFVEMINKGFSKYEFYEIELEVTPNGNLRFYLYDFLYGGGEKKVISINRIDEMFNIPHDISNRIRILWHLCKPLSTFQKSKDDFNNDNLISQSYRFDILKRDNYTCQLCGKTAQDGIKLEIDHKIPRSKGGSNHPDNLWVLCFDCNRGKSTKDL